MFSSQKHELEQEFLLLQSVLTDDIVQEALEGVATGTDAEG